MKLLDHDVVVAIWHTGAVDGAHDLFSILVRRGAELLMETRVTTGERESLLTSPPQSLDEETHMVRALSDMHESAAATFGLEHERVDIDGPLEVLLRKMAKKPWWHVTKRELH